MSSTCNASPTPSPRGRSTCLGLDGHDLVLELASRLRGGRLAVAGDRKRVLHLPRHAELLGDILARHAHWHEAALSRRELRHARVDATLPRHRIGRHRLHAACKADLVKASRDGRRNRCDRLRVDGAPERYTRGNQVRQKRQTDTCGRQQRRGRGAESDSGSGNCVARVRGWGGCER
eukprot:364988-Chlamydomonas_euryale.AAC.40